MSLRWHCICVDCADPEMLARWWAEALAWEITEEDEDGVRIAPSADGEPAIDFFHVPEPKEVKNRLHLDFVPDDQEAEVERLLALGATRADVGQGADVTWVVLADPEGNEFCVLSPR